MQRVSPGRRLAVSADGQTLFMLVAGAPDSVAVLDARTLLARGRVALEPGVLYRALVLAPTGDRLYAIGNRPGRVVDTVNRLREESAVVTSVELATQTVSTVTVREAGGRSWLVYWAAFSGDGSRLVITYHGGCNPDYIQRCTGGADWLDVSSGALERCQGQEYQSSGCSGQVHGMIEPFVNGFVAARGLPAVAVLDRDLRQVRLVQTRLRTHLMDFTLGGGTLYVVGDCARVRAYGRSQLRAVRRAASDRDRYAVSGSRRPSARSRSPRTGRFATRSVSLVDRRTGPGHRPAELGRRPCGRSPQVRRDSALTRSRRPLRLTAATDSGDPQRHTWSVIPEPGYARWCRRIVRLRAALMAAGASLLLAGVAGATPTRPVVLGISWEGVGKLAWFDARTLAPVGRRVNIGPPPTGVVARSPDGRTIALGSGTAAALRFIDIRAMRATGRLVVPGAGSLLYGIWPRPDRLVALLGGEVAEVLVIDPRARRVLERRPLAGQLSGLAPAGRRIVALLAPKGTIGQAQLAVIDENASVRTLPLPRVEAGFAPPKTERDVGRHASPGLAVDPRGVRAVIVTRETLLEVDLDALAVTRLHPLAARAPAAVLKAIEGWGRGALWLRGGTIAVSGWTDSVEGDRVVHETTGVELIDVASGTRRTLDARAIGATRARDVLLTFGGSALRGYDLSGNVRFELLRGRDTGYVQTAGRWVYVGRDNSTRFTVVDARARRVVGTATTPYPTIVLDSY